MRIKLLNTALCLLFTAAGLHAQETDYGAGAANVRFIPRRDFWADAPISTASG
ncbi:MAG: hypothetical protein ACLR8T_00280 [Alistipes finegoldii]